MERPMTVLQITLYHPNQDKGIFEDIPHHLEHDTTHLVIGRGHNAHLKFRLPGISRHHISLEPYLEKGNVCLTFCLKILSRSSSVWVNGLTLKYLEQVPLTAVSKVIFSGVQMVIHVEGGASKEKFACCIHFSCSPLIYRAKAEETDEFEAIQEDPEPPQETKELN
ncbi:TRAF-interacting protein with FHA domain-containing protein B [Trichosurus vulpecula]|uniref:TRAF-interacting protein with FHA domain-containing protein B n=1 Tax=Trichosurus vulpecula TaxID=9337 RepID=UPI00186B2116|nr:TRAF-interacting protein with FHA domain-containing protein B [Trichosurus vulpecula]